VPNDKGAIIISGAARGIGAAIARVLAADGYPVVINYASRTDAAQKVVADIKSAGGQAIAVKADVSSRQEVDAMVAVALKTFGRIDGAVNNACLPPEAKDFSVLKWEDIQKYIDVQIKGTFNLSQAVLGHFTPQGGCIVNIASIVADNVPPASGMPYNLVKSALISLTRTMAVELAAKKVRVNCVSPGVTMTDMIADFPEKVKLVAKMKTPLQRLAQPEDVAGAVAFLFSDRALFLTGETIRVNGGSSMV